MHKNGKKVNQYRCALFRIFCRQQCIIYMHTQGCALFFNIHIAFFGIFYAYANVYTKMQRKCVC